MSLKAFHIVFIVASTLIALLSGVWELVSYFEHPGGKLVDLVLGASCIVAAVALVIYGKYFLKKVRHIGYL